MRSWLLSVFGVVSVGVALTLLVLVESIFPPWAPYFVLYALLAIFLPLFLKTYAFGSFFAVMKSHWRLIIAVWLLTILWDQVVMGWLLEHFLAVGGMAGDPFYSLAAAIDSLSVAAGEKFGIGKDVAMALYAVFIVLWAPVGEELFYRGYIQGVLRHSRSFVTAALISSAFFGIRHVTHMFFLWPEFPLVAALTWAVGTFVYGLLMSYLYEKTQSLYPLILIHAVGNMIEILLSL